MPVPDLTLLLALLLALALFADAASADPAPADVLRWEPAGPSLPVGPLAGLPELADLDDDGHLDVVLACGPCCGMDPDPAAGHVSLLLGDGRGGLRPAGEPLPAGPSALRVATGDVDGDGHLDVAAIQHSSFEATILLGDGRGGLRPAPSPVTLHSGDRAHVHSVALADVDEDGRLDLLATLPDTHALAVHLGDGQGGFRPAPGQPFFAHLHPYEQLVLRDVDGDGHLDALCTDVSGNGVTVLLGSGTGMFAPEGGFRRDTHTGLAGAERPIALACGDVTGDGHPDLVAHLDESPWLVVLRGDGRGRFVAHEQGPIPTALPAGSLRLADLDGDGRLDVVTGSSGGDGFSYALGLGDGRFAPSRAVTGCGPSSAVAVGDMDGDGRPDVVASSYRLGTVRVFLNRPVAEG